jgi:hypothetical protein
MLGMGILRLKELFVDATIPRNIVVLSSKLQPERHIRPPFAWLDSHTYVGEVTPQPQSRKLPLLSLSPKLRPLLTSVANM